MNGNLVGRCVAEAAGTFVLVVVGCGSVVVDAELGAGLGSVGIGLAFGLAIMTMIYAVGESSGAHFNPAVTVAFWAAGRFPAKEIGPYVLAQVLAAIGGAALLWAAFPDNTGYGLTAPGDGVAVWTAGLIEIVITCVLMLVILRVSSGSKETGIMAGAAIGGVVAMMAMVFGPATGASMNPARSIGPALIAGDVSALWLYLIAPMLGALLSVPICMAIRGGKCCGVQAAAATPEPTG